MILKINKVKEKVKNIFFRTWWGYRANIEIDIITEYNNFHNINLSIEEAQNLVNNLNQAIKDLRNQSA